jgi:hypothetical protein
LLPYSVLAADALHGIGAAVVSAVFLHWWELFTDKRFLCTEILLPVVFRCYLARHCLVGIHITKFCTYNSKRLRCVIMFESEHAICCSHLRRWRDKRPSNKGDLDSSVTREVGRAVTRGCICFWFRSWCRT